MITPALLRVSNGVITLLFLPFLLKIYFDRREKFYLYWSIGYFLYGVNILLRTYLFFIDPDTYAIQIIAFLIFSIGFSLIIIGLGDLINQTSFFTIISLAVPFGMIMLYFVSPSVNAARMIGILPFVYLCVILLYIRGTYTVQLDLFIIGWIILLIINAAHVFELVSDSLVEIIAIASKVLLFLGMRSPRFSLLAEDFERFLISGKTGYSDNPNWHLTIVESNSSKAEEIQWIRDIISENKVRGVRTILITVYDIISINDVRGVMDFDDLYIIRMHQKGRIEKESFREQVMSINDDIGELGIVLDDIISSANEKKIRCQVIIHSLSTLIHVHGIKRVYSLFISKLPSIKGSQVQSYLLYYPQSHNDQIVTNQLLTLMDETITIE